MKILLIRPKYKSLFSLANPIQTEPLDLEYLAAIAKQENVQIKIHDEVVDKTSLMKRVKTYKPDVVALTGYITIQQRMIDYSRMIKQHDANITVVVGGVHAEINYLEFQKPSIDIIVLSGAHATFRELVRHDFQSLNAVPGITFRGTDNWIMNPPVKPGLQSSILPDRTHFYKYRDKFHYHYYGSAALLKSAMGCPFSCNFCFCRLLNDEKYLPRPIEDVITELKSIDHDLIWIVDDDFLIDRKRVEEFISSIRNTDLHKQYIIYGRADFIAENADLIPELKSVGVVDIIIGFETLVDVDLQSYEKDVTSQQNEQCATLLRDAGIQCTALFIAPLDATTETFNTLGSWIKKNDLDLFTISIFTPFPGTELYTQYADDFITQNRKHWDMLHLILSPTRMSKLTFYWEFYKLYLQLIFKNRRLRRFLLHSLIGRK